MTTIWLKKETAIMVRTIRDDEGEKQEKAQFLTLYTHQSGAFFFPLLTVKSRTTNRDPKHLSHFSFFFLKIRH